MSDVHPKLCNSHLVKNKSKCFNPFVSVNLTPLTVLDSGFKRYLNLNINEKFFTFANLKKYVNFTYNFFG